MFVNHVFFVCGCLTAVIAELRPPLCWHNRICIVSAKRLRYACIQQVAIKSATTMQHGCLSQGDGSQSSAPTNMPIDACIVTYVLT